MIDIKVAGRYTTAMSNPAPSSVLRSVAMARHLSAMALWFATLLARILPGSPERQAEAEMWRYIETTMAQFADLLERLAAGEIPPPHPKRARPSVNARQDSVLPRARPPVRHVRPKAQPRPNMPPPFQRKPAKPQISKTNGQSAEQSHAQIVTIIYQISNSARIQNG